MPVIILLMILQSSLYATFLSISNITLNFPGAPVFSTSLEPEDLRDSCVSYELRALLCSVSRYLLVFYYTREDTRDHYGYCYGLDDRSLTDVRRDFFDLLLMSNDD